MRDLKENPRTLTPDELSIILASTRHYEYKFTDITLDKHHKYIDFLQTASRYDFEFHCVVLDKENINFKRSFTNFWDTYIHYTKILCERSCHQGEKATLIADFNHRPKVAKSDFGVELRSLDCINNAMMLQSIGTPLIQLCDLLLGSVIFQKKLTTDKLKPSNRTKAKMEFVNSLEQITNNRKHQTIFTLDDI